VQNVTLLFMKNKSNIALYITTILSLISSALYVYAMKIEFSDPTNAGVLQALANWAFAVALLALVTFGLLKVAKK